MGRHHSGQDRRRLFEFRRPGEPAQGEADSALAEVRRDPHGLEDVGELRRVRVGSFTEKNCVKLKDIEKALQQFIDSGNENIKEFIKPVEAVEDNIGSVIIKDSAIYTITHGSPLYATGISKIENTIKTGDLVALMSLKGELVAIGNAMLNAEEMRRKKTLAVKTDRVIINKGAYPKLR